MLVLAGVGRTLQSSGSLLCETFCSLVTLFNFLGLRNQTVIAVNCLYIKSKGSRGGLVSCGLLPEEFAFQVKCRDSWKNLGNSAFRLLLPPHLWIWPQGSSGGLLIDEISPNKCRPALGWLEGSLLRTLNSMFACVCKNLHACHLCDFVGHPCKQWEAEAFDPGE